MTDTDTANPAENAGEQSAPLIQDVGVQPSGPIGDTAPPEAQEDGPQSGDENREAAKYRHRAKAAEAERDQLTERLTVLQRAEVERLASAHLADGADFWRDGAQLADMLDADGNIDPDKIAATATALLTAHGHWRKLGHPAPPASTVTSDGKIGGSRRPSFVDAFRPRSE
ncbi:hypothetical protein LAUMK136_05600 [Mycobacterium attenuatum]|uniref:Uncharacterized protein n=1 Tax=Mycobacterium attenuatum TaxID=2341086 RepID=A0A498QFJ5_9MYCO|nr:hypothetical protein [Mycobacterium attenuatum]VBA44356.1 hypothetical protein LAUMK136_05600 [Mycobacterium attenuatum]